MNTTPNDTGAASRPAQELPPQETAPYSAAQPAGQNIPFSQQATPAPFAVGGGVSQQPHPQPFPSAPYGYAPVYAPYPPPASSCSNWPGGPQAAPTVPAPVPAAYVPVGYAPTGYAVPAPQPAYAAPPFALGGARAPRDPRVKGASKSMNRMCLLVVAQIAAAFLWQVPLMLLMTFLGINVLTDDFAYLWLSAAMVPLSTALPFLVYLMVGRKDFSQYLKFEKVGLFGGALCVLGGLAICLLANYPSFLLQDFLGNFGYESAAGAAFTQADSWPALILELLTTAVLVPVMEEFAFRGVLLSALRKYGMGFAVVASALVFSLVHLDVANVLFALIAGLVFGFLYARTNNLWLTIAIHALNNGIAVLTNHTDFLFGEQMAYVAENALMLVPVAVGALALIILVAFKRDLFITYLSPRYDGPERPLKAGEAALSIAGAPLFWVVTGMMVLYTATLFF